jgi:DNA-directed RNA polymerase specialized sigma24 family protein
MTTYEPGASEQQTMHAGAPQELASAANRELERGELAAMVACLMPVVRMRAARARARGALREQTVDDLVQEIWLALLANDSRRLRAWDESRGVPRERFVAVLADRALAALIARTRARRRASTLVTLDSCPESALARNDTPERELIVRETLRLVARQLPLRGQAVLLEFWGGQRDAQAIASALGVARQVVYNWQHRIRLVLANIEQR